MRAPDWAAAVEIGERAGELEHPVIAPRGETQTFGRFAQQAKVRVCDLLDQMGRGGCVAGDAVKAKIGIARKLDAARGGDPRRPRPILRAAAASSDRPQRPQGPRSGGSWLESHRARQ
jgi:hypothetical protein